MGVGVKLICTSDQLYPLPQQIAFSIDSIVRKEQEREEKKQKKAEKKQTNKQNKQTKTTSTHNKTKKQTTLIRYQL